LAHFLSFWNFAAVCGFFVGGGGGEGNDCSPGASVIVVITRIFIITQLYALVLFVHVLLPVPVTASYSSVDSGKDQTLQFPTSHLVAQSNITGNFPCRISQLHGT